MLKVRFGVDIVHVAYKRTAQLMLEAVVRRVHFIFDSAARLFARDGRLRLLPLRKHGTDPWSLKSAHVRYCGIEVDDVLEISEQTEI